MNEKLTFFEALERVVGSDRRIRDSGKARRTTDWSTYETFDRPCLITKKTGSAWWPKIEAQIKRAWEVETEIPEEIFIWGLCWENGVSCIAANDEVKKIWEERYENRNIDEYIVLQKNNIFPKDKPQKYKLVPVDDKPADLKEALNEPKMGDICKKA